MGLNGGGGIKTKKNSIRLIGIVLLLLVIIYITSSTKTSKVVLELCSPYIESSGKVQSYQSTLMLKGGLYDQVGQRLKEKGYEHLILTGTNSKDEIMVKVVLINMEANERRQEKVKQVFNDFIIKNELDPKLFIMKVSNDESLNW